MPPGRRLGFRHASIAGLTFVQNASVRTGSTPRAPMMLALLVSLAAGAFAGCEPAGINSASDVKFVGGIPASVQLAPGDTQRFRPIVVTVANDTLSVPAVTWVATGGTITTDGLYTAGQTTGTGYRVIGTHAASGLADTSNVTIVPLPP